MFDRLPHRIRKLAYRLVRGIPGLPGNKRLLIVRLDAIGDYVLFRNSLHILKNSSRFREYSFTLLGNRTWRDLAAKLDGDVIENFIWINPDTLHNRNSFSYSRFQLLLKLKIKGFSVIIHPVHSRVPDVDYFIHDIGAPVRIASSGDDINYNQADKADADKLYTEIITVPGPDTFEFLRNRQFIAGITNNEFTDLNLSIARTAKPAPGIKIAIAPGAGHVQRRWPAIKFAGLIKMLSGKFPGAAFYLFGSEADVASAEIIKKHTSGCTINDLTNRASLPELVEQFQKMSLVVANDSSAFHLAAAMDIPTVCISNGNMFGRFQPYPETLKKPVQVVYPDPSFYNPDKFKTLVEKTSVQSKYDISVITVEEVYNACNRVFTNSDRNISSTNEKQN